jgi:hypothetical protein
MGNTQETIEVKIKALVAGLREVQKLQTEIKGIEKLAGKKLSVNVSGTDRALKFIRELFPAADGVIDRLQGIEKASGASFGNMVVGAGLAGAGLLALGNALYSALQQLDKLIDDTIEAGSRFHDLSVESGLSVETLSGLQSQARQSGTDLETLSKGVFFLQKNLQSASEGNKELRRTFAELGITDVDAALKDTEGTFRKVLKALAEITNEGKRNATGAEVMGRGYESLRNFVADLNGEVDETIDTSRALGLVMSNEAAAAADQLGDQLQLLKDRAEALRLKFGAELLPVMEDFLDTIEARLNRNAKDFEQWADRVGVAADMVKGVMVLAETMTFTGASQAEKDAARGSRLAGVAIENVVAARKRSGDFSPRASGGGKGGGGGKTKPSDPEDTFDSALGVGRAQLESSFNNLKDWLERANKAVEQKLKERLISIKDFFQEQESLQTDAVAAEIEKIEGLQYAEKLRHDHELDRIKGDQQKKKLTEDQAFAKRVNENNKNKEATLKLEEQLIILGRERAEISDRIAQAEKEANAALSEEIGDFLEQFNELNGRTSQNVMRAIHDRLDPLLERIIEEQGEDSPLANLIKQFIELTSASARIDELIGRAGRAQGSFETRAAEIDSRTEANVISEARARREINALLQETIEKQSVIYQQALAIAEASQNPQEILRIRRLIAELEKLKRAQVSLGQELKNAAINSAVDGLANLFSNIARDASNAKEYVRDFFASFLEELNRAIIRMLVMKAIMAVLGFLGGGGDVTSWDPDTGIAIPGNAEGDMHSATPGGRIIRVAEGGYDEVVLTTDPRHRIRTERLLAAFLSRTGMLSPFARGGFASGESILASITSGIPRLAAGDFISNLPEPNFAALTGGNHTTNFNFRERQNGQSRIPSRAAFRDAARMLKGTTT